MTPKLGQEQSIRWCPTFLAGDATQSADYCYADYQECLRGGKQGCTRTEVTWCFEPVDAPARCFIAKKDCKTVSERYQRLEKAISPSLQCIEAWPDQD